MCFCIERLGLATLLCMASCTLSKLILKLNPVRGPGAGGRYLEDDADTGAGARC